MRGSVRERKEDIPVLIDYFLRIQSEEEKRLVPELNPSALSPLIEYPWHGNVRELKNFIEKIVILYPGEEISSEKAISLLERSSVEEVQKTTSQTLVDARKKAEREAILAKLIANKWNYEETAKALNISRATLFNKFKEFEIKSKKLDFSANII
jgi:two-component system nitrogen regulation response regulator NtrX